jgi:hypothetical protein
MLRHHMAVITADRRLKREVQRVTAATGSTADYTAEPATWTPEKPPDLVIFDARQGPPDPSLKKKIPNAPFIWILEEQKLFERIDGLSDDRVVSLMCHDERFDDDEFIASATKTMRGTVFGLPKYFPWGVTTYTMVVKNYEEKSRAIEMILHYAGLAGIRGPVRDRIQVVADELMMNGLYHAPTDADGKERFRDKTVREIAQLAEVPPIEVQYGSSGRYFGMSVRDGGGSLTRPRVVEYLKRAVNGTATIENKTSGAGLGLITVLHSVSKLVFNLDPGRSTEVIGLFDLELFAKGKVGARSVHVFTSREPPEVEAEPEPEPEKRAETEPVMSLAPRRRGLWAVAAILFALVAGLGGALVSRRFSVGVQDARGAERLSGSEPALMVLSAEPRDAEIKVNDQAVTPGQPTAVASNQPVLIHMEAPGYQPFELRIEPEQLAGRFTLHVPLAPSATAPQGRRAHTP